VLRGIGYKTLMNSAIDWQALAKEVGAIQGDQQFGGSDYARSAIVRLLGSEVLRDAVDYYISFQPGSELARSVLWLLRPVEAMERCYEIYREDPLIERRRQAVELLRVVADAQMLPKVREFLNDTDGDIQQWGAGMLDQLVWSQLVDAMDAEPYLRMAEVHANEHVRERAAFIRDVIRRRSAGASGESAH
jgi:hypothetical protein